MAGLEAAVQDNPTALSRSFWLAWLPMLVDVHYERCRYATYVGTGILSDLVEVTADERESRGELIGILLAQLLMFEVEGFGLTVGAREQPPPTDLTQQRTRLISAGLRAWARQECKDLDGVELAAAVLDDCPPDLRLAVDCVLLPITKVHDEVLFIRVLQVFEVVFLQMYALLASGRDRMAAGDLVGAADHFSQGADVLDKAFPVFRVLATMRPESFAVIRTKTTGASGLQSEAFKRIELLGGTPTLARADSEAFTSDEVAQHLGREQPSIETVLGRSRTARTDPRVLAGLEAVNRSWLRWKRSHWAVASHVIGASPGTGGTSGVSYLLEYVLDPLVRGLPHSRADGHSRISLGTRIPVSPMVEYLRRDLARSIEREVAVIHAPRRRLGDFKVDVRTIIEGPAEADRDVCSAVADDLTSRGEIDRAVPVPPNVYVTPRLEVLAHVVTAEIADAGQAYARGKPIDTAVVQVQYACPNLNKGLHVGHLRNAFLGAALANIVEAAGHRVIRVDQPSNRGKHIAKAVLAYQLWGDESTPASTAERPDQFVQRFYAQFASHAADGDDAALTEQLDRTLDRLEVGDPEVVQIADRLTAWAYEGIQQTYGRIGIRFDAVFAEGDTLDLAEDVILGSQDVALRRPDQSVYVDLSDRGLREITLLRQDGSPLLHAQFLGACLRRQQLDPDTTLLFVMGEEYRHTVPELLGTLELLGHERLAARIEAVHHGMVTIDGTKLSSREMGVPTADSLLDEVRDRLADDWERESGQRLGFHERDVCDRLAVAMVKYLFLGTRRDRAIDWDLDALWESIPGKIRRVVMCLDEGADGRGWREPSKRDGEDVRSTLLHLDRFGACIEEALDRRDPFVLVRYLDDLCSLSRAATASTLADPRLPQAAAAVARTTLGFLDIQLPPFGALPPVFGSDSPRGRGQPKPVDRGVGR